MKNFTSNSNFNELNEFDYVTSKNQFFETTISINAQFDELQNLQNSQRNSQNLLYDKFNENELTLIAKNINFDSITYHNVIIINFDLTKWKTAMNKEINDLQTQNT